VRPAGEPDPRWTKEFSVLSRRWAFLVNGVAASPYVSPRARAAIMRRQGIEIETDQIYPRCYFHTCNVHLAPGSILNHGVYIENVARVEVGEYSGLGMFTVVLTSTHEPGPPSHRYGVWAPEPVKIGRGCWIAARVVILPGVTIGDGCIVAAGAVVHSDCEPHGFYAGVPAKRIKDLPV
jgi:maltose O-acetyltransferase